MAIITDILVQSPSPNSWRGLAPIFRVAPFIHQRRLGWILAASLRSPRQGSFSTAQHNPHIWPNCFRGLEYTDKYIRTNNKYTVGILS